MFSASDTHTLMPSYMSGGARTVWRELNWQREQVARCTVEGLMLELGLRGVVPGKKVRATVPDPAAERAPDLVRGNFVAAAPGRCWIATSHTSASAPPYG